MNIKSLPRIGERALSAGSLGSYIHWVNQIPMLSLEEEQDLANKFIQFNDLEAARQLVLSHLRFVVRIARGYAGYGLCQADLIQEGNIGLMKAVKRFNPKMGVRLVSFAVHWVRAEMHEFILRNWRIVKVATTKAQRKLFFNLRKYSKQLGWFSPEEARVIAEELNVSPKEVHEMESRLSSYDESFDGHDENEDIASWKIPANYLEDKRANPAAQLERSDWSGSQEQRLHQALMTLDARSQDILQQRWLGAQKATLQDLADKYEISVERVRQLEKSAMNKLHSVLKN